MENLKEQQAILAGIKPASSLYESEMEDGEKEDTQDTNEGAFSDALGKGLEAKVKKLFPSPILQGKIQQGGNSYVFMGTLKKKFDISAIEKDLGKIKGFVRTDEDDEGNPIALFDAELLG